MGNHRMFSLSVIDTDQFNDMPLSARLLYYELGLRADDDGFIASPKKIIKMIGCSEDDLKALIEEGFVICFESGIIAITHWHLHNKIRKNRKKDTIYSEEKQYLTLNGNGVYVLHDNKMSAKCQPNDDQMSANCQPTENKLSAQDKISKDKISKDKISKDKLSKDKDIVSADADFFAQQPRFDFQAVTDSFNSVCVSLPKVQKLNDKRRRAVKNAGRLLGDVSFDELFARVERSDFLTGRSGKWSGCGFDWVLQPSNLTKILEGNYDNKQAACEVPQQRNYDEVF